MLEVTRRLEEFLRQDLGAEGFIALHEPAFQGNEQKFLVDCVESGWVSSVGSYVDQFEVEMAKATQCSFGVAVVNGTAGLHVGLYALGVQPGDYVLAPSLTFIATANAISHCGAKPLLADVENETFGLCPDKLREFLSQKCLPGKNGPTYQGSRIAACVPVHIFGHSCKIDEIINICREYDIAVIEDATESLGSFNGKKATGSFADIAVFSFNGNKIITTGGGGMLTTNDETLAKRLKHLTTTARVAHQWNFDHDEVAWNYRMPNINAALGCAQLEQLDDYLAKKRQLANRYRDLFSDLNGVQFHDERPGTRSNFWLNAVLLDNPADRDVLLQETADREIMTRPVWRLMHDVKPYRNAKRTGDLNVAEDIASRLVNIPSTPGLV